MSKWLMLLLLVLSSAVGAQVFQGIVTGPARTYMTHHWDTRAKANETLYCVTRWAVSPERIVFVLDVELAEIDSATPYSVRGFCGDSTVRYPTIHTHTPTTCRIHAGKTTCVKGGIDAWVCWPSPGDLASLIRGGALFSAVQCSRDAFVFYGNPFYGLIDSTAADTSHDSWLRRTPLRRR